METLYDASNDNNKVHLYKDVYIMPDDKFSFFTLPCLMALICVIMGGLLNNTISNALLLFITISIPLLFSLLILIYNMGQKLVDNDKITPKDFHARLSQLKQIKSNISFTILVSFGLLILLVLWSSLAEGSYLSNWIIIPYGGIIYKIIISLIIYVLVGVTLITLLMVLKRFYILIDDSLK